MGRLPEDKGTYVLIASVCQMKRLEIGALGKFDIVPGFYSYVGSAFGPVGLRARIGHHLESTAAPHWHIDYTQWTPGCVCSSGTTMKCCFKGGTQSHLSALKKYTVSSNSQSCSGGAYG